MHRAKAAATTLCCGDFSVHWPSTQTMASSHSFCTEWLCLVACHPVDLFPLGQVSAFVQWGEAGGEVLRSNVAAMGSDVWRSSVPKLWTAVALWPQVPKLEGVQVVRRKSLVFWDSENDISTSSALWDIILDRHCVSTTTGPNLRSQGHLLLSYSPTPRSKMSLRREMPCCVPEAKNLS